MRPRCPILICDSNPVTVSILRFVLEIRGPFVVTEVSCAYDAIEMLKYVPFRMLLTNFTLYGSGGVELTRRVKELWPEMKVAVYGEDRRLMSKHQSEAIADCWLPGSLRSLGPLVEQVRILSWRKRGPRKGFRMPFHSRGIHAA